MKELKLMLEEKIITRGKEILNWNGWVRVLRMMMMN